MWILPIGKELARSQRLRRANTPPPGPMRSYPVGYALMRRNDADSPGRPASQMPDQLSRALTAWLRGLTPVWVRVTVVGVPGGFRLSMRSFHPKRFGTMKYVSDGWYGRRPDPDVGAVLDVLENVQSEMRLLIDVWWPADASEPRPAPQCARVGAQRAKCWYGGPDRLEAPGAALEFRVTQAPSE
jgi:hypothetical protein